MYYDEDAQKRRDRMSQVLGVPVSDFELSVRSRNCLQKMGIRTLGDLARCTEQDLLASKNFGETSLVKFATCWPPRAFRWANWRPKRWPSRSTSRSSSRPTSKRCSTVRFRT